MALIKHSQRTTREGCKFCGRKDLYWAHDTDKPYDKPCNRCLVNGAFALIEMDGTRHDCRGIGHHDQEPAVSEASEPVEPWIEPAPVRPAAAPVPATPPPSDDRMGALAALLDLLAPKVDAAQVEKIIDDRLRGLVLPMRVEVTRNGETRAVDGLAHSVLPKVITILGAGLHCMMVGPAGTGKSHIASQAAEALETDYYSISLTPQTPTSAILGYMTATGDYVRTAFREAYENGGVFHFDELDNGHPSTLGVVNAALANGHMAFPDGMVKRNDGFLCVASANTYGRGPDRAYVGRQAIDAATLDRFAVITVDVDEALEESLCLATGLEGSKVKQVLAYVRHLRGKAIEYKLPLVFSPRTSHGMCALLNAGLTVREAIEMRARRGISDADWRKVIDGAPMIYGI